MTNAAVIDSTARRIVPTHMAHIVFKTKQYEAMVDWYKKVFLCDTMYADQMLTFLTFDDEHHRFAIGRMPDTFADLNPASVGVAHYAMTYGSIADLVATYERLRDMGIVPFWPNNHGLTTSLYYRDPDGNEIELQADNFSTPEQCKAVFSSAEYLANPIGNTFDPEVFVKGFHQGRSFDDIMREAIDAAVKAGMKGPYQ
jgi:catechol-2,3-dioxygenase